MSFPSSSSGAGSLPYSFGQLRVTAAMLEGRRSSDAFELTTAPNRDLGLALLDLRLSPLEPRPKLEHAGLRQQLLELAVLGLREATPLHAIMLDLIRKLFDAPLSQLGVTLLRCSAVDARVEIATAGMPKVGCAHSSGELTLHGVASPALTAHSHAPAPIELTPLSWGSTWLAISDGFSADLDQSVIVERLARELELLTLGSSLSQEPPDALRELLLALPIAATRHEREDATLVLLTADPSARLQSGFERRR